MDRRRIVHADAGSGLHHNLGPLPDAGVSMRSGSSRTRHLRRLCTKAGPLPVHPCSEKLLPQFGMKPVFDGDKLFYCVGGRTAIGIEAALSSIVTRNWAVMRGGTVGEI